MSTVVLCDGEHAYPANGPSSEVRATVRVNQETPVEVKDLCDDCFGRWWQKAARIKPRPTFRVTPVGASST